MKSSAMSTSCRNSDSKRHSSSKYDREPSPKRSRRYDAEKGRSKDDGDATRGSDYNQKHSRPAEAEDPLPLEAPSNKAEDAVGSKGSDKKTDQLNYSDKKKESDKKENGNQSKAEKKHSLEPTEMPRSRSHIQHDDRGNTRRSDRSSNQRPSSDRVWGKDSRDQRGDREMSRFKNHSRDDKAADRGYKDRAWRHDGFFELEAKPPQPDFRKRPASSEWKIAVEDDKKELPNKSERDERGRRIPRHLERDRGVRRPFNGDRGVTNKGEQQGFGPSSRDRFAGPSGNNRARDGTYGRQGPQTTGAADKWKHDMFSDFNRSPTPRNEEDQIAKVEALLAS